MTYQQAIEFLYSLRMFGAKFGLDNTFKLAALAGRPHERLRFIHVAGTNGKGSVCAMLESIYRAAGWRVGLFTSPHLVAFGERIQVNRRLMSEADVVRWVGRMQGWLREFPATAHPTFFEVVTVLALLHFAEQNCDLVIWETGLGGRLDATNIVTPLASVITNVDFDHQQWLGRTLPQIASEKAGIIKPHVPVLTAEHKDEVWRVFLDVAQSRHAPLIRVSQADTQRPPLDQIQLPLLGDHQRLNAALALATVRALAQTIPVEERTARTGLTEVHWPGRLQIFRPDPGRTILLDGAHNPAGADTLRKSLQKYFPDVRPTLVFGVMADKDWTAICRILVPLADRICVAPIQSTRSADPHALRELCQRLNPQAKVRACASMDETLKLVALDPLVVVTGSLYLVGEAMEALRISPTPALEERSLNDWSATPAGPERCG